MGIEKDTTFKFIGKNVLEILLELANMSDSIDSSSIEEVTEDLISLKISQLKPDFIGKNNEIILMIEFESSYVGKPSKKRFHAYVALYDYEKNDEDLDIYFCVITTLEKSKIVEHKIGDIDNFKIRIFNIRDLGFEEIINNANYKIKNQEVFSLKELVKLALTSLMPGTREGNINQFYKLSDMLDSIVFSSEEDKISFTGLLLLLSDIYFDVNDPMRKKIEGVFMNRVDCIAELCQDKFNEGLREAARNLLSNGFSVEIVSQNTNLPLNKIKELEEEIKSGK